MPKQAPELERYYYYCNIARILFSFSFDDEGGKIL